MSWREQLRSGSFRGVPFVIDAAETASGRRAAIHEYPGRDRPYVEDLGRKRRELSVECLVVGPDYMAARDALIEACEKPGPGTLVHPYYGERRVVCTGVRIRETTREGGLARFSIAFVEAGENLEPRVTTARRAEIEASADAALLAVRDQLARELDVTGPALLEQAAAGVVADLAEALEEAAAGLPASLPSAPRMDTVLARLPAGDFTDAMAEVLRPLLPAPVRGLVIQQLQRLASDATSLVRAPESLAGRLAGAMRVLGLMAGGARPETASAALTGLASWGDDLPPVPATTATRRRQARHQAAIVWTARGVAAIESARTAAGLTFADRDAAVAVRDQVSEALDAVMETADDAAYHRLAAVRAATVRDLGERAASLVPLRRYTPGASLPALVIAHKLYGDAGRAGEILARNRVRHPGFVPGGQPLEVLSA